MNPDPKFSALEQRKVEALRHLLQWQTRKWDIQVVHTPNATLKTDGKRVWIPYIPNDVYDKHRRIIFGGVIHEGAHIKRSDFPLKLKTIKDGVESMLTNAIEDFRIEHFECIERPSLDREFKENREYYIGEFLKKYNSDPNMASAVLTNPELFLRLFGGMIYQYLWGDDISGYPPTLHPILKKIEDDLDEFRAKMVDGTQGSWQAWECAKKIKKKMEEFFSKFGNKLKDMMQQGGDTDEEETETADDNKKQDEKEDKKDQEGEGTSGGEEDGKEEPEKSEGEEDGEGSGEGEPTKNEVAENGDEKKQAGTSSDDEGNEEAGEGDEAGGKTGSEDSDDDEEEAGGKGSKGVELSDSESRNKLGKSGKGVSGKGSKGDSKEERKDGQPTDDNDPFSRGRTEKEARISSEIQGYTVDEEDDSTLVGTDKATDQELEDIFRALKDAEGNAGMSIVFDPNDTTGAGGVPAYKLLDAAAKAGIKDLYQDVFELFRDEIQADSIKSKQHIPHPDAVLTDKVEYSKVNPSEAIKASYNRTKLEIQKEISLLRTKLLSLIMAQKRVHFLPDAEEGEIDISALWSLKHGNKRIFQEHNRGRKLNTAVTILIDNSGSMMSGGKYTGATKAVIAMSEVFNILKVPFEVLGFTTSCNCPVNIHRLPAEQREIYNRFEGLWHIVFKKFEDNFQSVKYNLLAIKPVNNNCDGESVRWAAERLLQRKEVRKMLFVLSDGMPHCNSSREAGGTGLLNRDLRSAVLEIRRAGAECYGIGIYTDGPREFYEPDFSYIDIDEDNIAKAIFKCLEHNFREGVWK